MSLVSRKVNQISHKTIFLRGVLYSTKDVLITLCDTCPIFCETCLKSREEIVSHQSRNDSNLSRYVLRFFSFLTELRDVSFLTRRVLLLLRRFSFLARRVLFLARRVSFLVGRVLFRARCEWKVKTAQSNLWQYMTNNKINPNLGFIRIFDNKNTFSRRVYSSSPRPTNHLLVLTLTEHWASHIRRTDYHPAHQTNTLAAPE